MIKFFIVDVLLTGTQHTIFGMGLGAMLEERNYRKKGFLYALIQVIVYIVVFYVFQLVMPYKSYVMMLSMFASCAILFRASIIRKILSIAIGVFTALIPEVIASQIFYRIYGELGITVEKFEYMFWGKLIGVILPIPLLIMFVFIWRSIIKRSFNKVLKEYLIFVVSQAALLCICFYISYISEKTALALAITSVALVVCMIADYFLFRSLKKANERYMLVQKNRVIEEQLNTQLDYYSQLKENIDRNNKLSHDYLNQMQTIGMLLESGNVDSARSQLSEYSNLIHNNRAQKYCANEIVNAVIEAKARLCRDEGAIINVDVKIPREIAIDGVHLCSVFSNLLDNAIESCLRAKEAPCFINLNAGIVANSLVIKQENTNPKIVLRSNNILESSKEELYHGLGIEIVREIAKIYHGEIECTATDTVFTTLVRLGC